MRYKVTYLDNQSSPVTIEAPSSQDAATIFVFQQLRPNQGRVLVTAETGETEEFITSDILSSGSADSSAEIVQMLNRRYAEAYTEARTLVSAGKLIKGVAAFLAVASNLGGCYMASSANTIPYLIGGAILACAVCIPVYVLGVMVAAQGQTTQVMLDTAVNSSRHLSDDDVARIILRRGNRQCGES